MTSERIRFDHPANRSVLEYLKRHWDGSRPQNLSAPPTVYDLDSNPLGTHPDLADYFWKTLTAKLPQNCSWVCYGNPVLVHPNTGIIFGFAGGTHAYALRLPVQTRLEAIRTGAKTSHTYSNGTQLLLEDIGTEWIFGTWFKDEPEWCRSAYEAAGNIAFQDFYPDDVSHCYGCGRLNQKGHQIKSYWDGDETVSTFFPKPEHTAIPGYVYGGLLASLIDCHGTGSAAAAMYKSQGREMGSEPPLRYVTASLHVDYLKPTPLGPMLTIRGRIKEIKGRKVIVSVEISANETVCARGEVVAVQMPESMIKAQH